ncbi:MAG: hypothetical protein IAE67_11430 [Candidatus Competibacteraceae bacterium]|nr:hypothetical protein [Candidatus Competibacteraceae bacterium]
MKKIFHIYLLILINLSGLILTINNQLHAIPRKSWTYKEFDSIGQCWRRYVCSVPSSEPNCNKGTVSPWVCICEPWNCQDF